MRPILSLVLCLAPLTACNADDADPIVKGKALSAWFAEARGPDSRARYVARETILNLGKGAAPAVPALVAALSDPSDDEATFAEQVLTNIGSPAAKAAVPGLITNLQRRSSPWAAAALGELGPDAVAAIPALTAAMKHENPKVRLEAAMALGKTGAAAVPLIREGLESKDRDVRLCYLNAAGCLGPHSKEVLPVLVANLSDPEVRIRDRSIDALGVIGAPAKPALRPLLKDKDPKLRRVGLYLLSHVEPDAETIAATVGLLTADPDSQVVDSADRALSIIGRAAVPAIIPLLKSPEKEIRLRGVRALQGLKGKDAAEAAPQLLELFLEAKEDHLIRVIAFAVLKAADPELLKKRGLLTP